MLDTNRFIEALKLGLAGNQEAALEELRALVELTSDAEERGWVILAEVTLLREIGKFSDARQHLVELASTWPPNVVEYHAEIDVADALLDEAEEQWVSALHKMQRIMDEYAALWRIHEDEIQVLYEDVRFSLGRLLVRTKQWRKALPIFEECQAYDRPKNGDFYYFFGLCCFETRQWEKAEYWLRHACSYQMIDSYKSASHYYLGRLAYRKGTLAKAAAEFETAAIAATDQDSARKIIYGELAKTYKYLHMDAESKHYETLARQCS